MNVLCKHHGNGERDGLDEAQPLWGVCYGTRRYWLCSNQSEDAALGEFVCLWSIHLNCWFGWKIEVVNLTILWILHIQFLSIFDLLKLCQVVVLAKQNKNLKQHALMFFSWSWTSLNYRKNSCQNTIIKGLFGLRIEGMKKSTQPVWGFFSHEFFWIPAFTKISKNMGWEVFYFLFCWMGPDAFRTLQCRLDPSYLGRDRCVVARWPLPPSLSATALPKCYGAGEAWQVAYRSASYYEAHGGGLQGGPWPRPRIQVEKMGWFNKLYQQHHLMRVPMIMTIFGVVN